MSSFAGVLQVYQSASSYFCEILIMTEVKVKKESTDVADIENR